MNDTQLHQLAERWVLQCREGFDPPEHYAFLRDVEKYTKDPVPWLDEIAILAQSRAFNETYRSIKMAKVKSTPAPVEVPKKGAVKSSPTPAVEVKEKKAGIPREPKVPADAKLVWASKENPKRAGSASHERFAAYMGAKTVAAYLEAGGTRADLAHDLKKGFFTVG